MDTAQRMLTMRVRGAWSLLSRRDRRDGRGRCINGGGLSQLDHGGTSVPRGDVDEVGGDHCAQRSNHREAPVGMPVEAGNGEMRRSTAGAGVGEVVVDDVVAQCVDRSSGLVAQSSG